MDTEALKLFVRAAELLNISAAGRELDLAPAVASARLAKLEHALGADLLHRNTRRVSLSLQGSEFLPFAREILAQEDAARAALGHGTRQATGTLRFAAPSSFAQLYIAPLLPKFLDANPRLTLDMRLSDSITDLIEGSFDLALRNTALADSSLKGRKLAADKRILVASPSYLAAHSAPDTPSDLAEHRLIGFGDAPRQLRASDGAGGQFDPKSAASHILVNDGMSQRNIARAGGGIAVGSLWAVHADLASGQLQRVMPTYDVADEANLWLVYPKTNVLSVKVRVFLDFLLSELGAAPPWEIA